MKEAYQGLNIDPFRPFEREDWYGYAGAEKIGRFEPLIYNGNYCTIVISGSEEDPRYAHMEVDLTDYMDYEAGDDIYFLSPDNKPETFHRLLSQGKKLANIDMNDSDSTPNELFDMVDELGLIRF